MTKRLALAASLASLTLAALPGVASALPVSRNTETVPSTAGALTQISVKCPADRTFVSGGFSASDEAGLDGVNVVEASWDGKRTWTITVQRAMESMAAQDVTALARCGETAPKLTVVKARKAGGDGMTGAPTRAVAKCGKGRVATAGGFTQPQLDDQFMGGGTVLASKRSGSRAWSVLTRAFMMPGALRAEAYCLKTGRNRLVKQSQPLGTDPMAPTTATTERCGGGEARAGGWKIANDDPTYSPEIYTSTPVDKGWSTSIADMADMTGMVEGTLTTFGYCP